METWISFNRLSLPQFMMLRTNLRNSMISDGLEISQPPALAVRSPSALLWPTRRIVELAYRPFMAILNVVLSEPSTDSTTKPTFLSAPPSVSHFRNRGFNRWEIPSHAAAPPRHGL